MMELLVPTISDIVFKYTWLMKNYKKTIAKCDSIDSPTFDVNVNGIISTWNLSIRFWKSPDGKRITNPIVLCLNMINCTINEAEQAKIRFQFALFNAELKSWEYCHVSRTILELKSTSEIISLGYRDLSIVDRHFRKNGQVMVMVKIQILQYDSDKQYLTQDTARPPKHSRDVDIKLTYSGVEGQAEMPVYESNTTAECTGKVPLNRLNTLEVKREDRKDDSVDDKKK